MIFPESDTKGTLQMPEVCEASEQWLASASRADFGPSLGRNPDDMYIPSFLHFKRAESEGRSLSDEPRDAEMPAAFSKTGFTT